MDAYKIIEYVGVVTGLACVLLGVLKSVWNWPLGIVSVICYGVVFWHIKLYADMGLQGFFLVTGFIGWWSWLKGGKGHTPLPVTTLTWPQRALWLVGIAALVATSTYCLAQFTDGTFPFRDSLVSGLSIAAQLLLMRKVFETWILWVAVDLIAIPLYLDKDIPATAGLYLVFLVLATMGLLAWLQDVRRPAEA